MATAMLIVGGVFLALIFIAAVAYIVGIYNGLIQLKNNIRKSWANINVLLKQRSDELPKLIKSVKGYMKHEAGTLKVLTDARTAFMRAKTKEEKAAADSMITSTLKTLFAVAENYPNLKANENFMHLQARISGLENELSDRREFYNDSVNQYNIRIESFPDLFVAKTLSYKHETMFKVAEADKKDVEINF